MERLTILSPHFDDAVFSLGLALEKWRRLGNRLHIVNFFTVSQYAPFAAEADIQEISRIRMEEDRLALQAVDRSIDIASLGLLDAPLRLQIPFEQVMLLSTAERISSEFLQRLTSLILEHAGEDLLLAPLALGDHVDHAAVHRAALQTGSTDIGFYEDLPYATWTSAERLQERVKSAENLLGFSLKPIVVTHPQAVEYKTELAARYQSQISRETAVAIAGFAANYGGVSGSGLRQRVSAGNTCQTQSEARGSPS